jgi:glycosyltransferase involved in cell wall biosynthesis
MTNPPSISVQIPTLNSPHLRQCLFSIDAEDYPNVEKLVIDGGSSSRLIEVAYTMGAKVLLTRKPLLASRRIGIESSSSDVILLMDSDQTLRPRTLWRIAEKIESYDMLVLEERASSDIGFLQRLYDSDRVVAQCSPAKWDPITGVAMPRAFRSKLLQAAIEKIPASLDPIRYPDHALIYFEASRLSTNVGMISDALFHEENTSVTQLIHKHFGYGRDAALVAKTKRYRGLVWGKSQPRTLPEDHELHTAWLRAQVLMFMKAVPYLIGYHLAGPSRETESNVIP